MKILLAAACVVAVLVVVACCKMSGDLSRQEECTARDRGSEKRDAGSDCLNEEP